MEPTEAAQRRYNAWIDRRLAGTVWDTGGCASWYLDASGRNSTLWPSYATSFRRRLRRFRPADYTAVMADTAIDDAVAAVAAPGSRS